jgi:HlyD family secretion protein
LTQPTHRVSSVERLISPDRADALPAVSHAPKRLFLFGAALLLATTFAWLGFGKIDTRVRGACILISPQGMADVTSNGEGRLEGLQLQPGQMLSAGQPLARIRRADFEQQQATLTARVAELRSGKAHADRLIAAGLSLGQGGFDREQATLAARQQTVAARLVLAQRQLAGQRALQADGLVTRQALLAAEQRVDALNQEHAQLGSQLSQLAFKEQQERRQLSGEARQLALALDLAERQLALLEQQQQQRMVLRSPFAGRVVEVKAHDGAVVTVGSNVATIERSAGTTQASGPLVALIFVKGSDGKLLQQGMPAEITPTNVKRQEFGFIRASIATVSDFPASRESIAQVLQNPEMVRELAGDRAPTQVQALLSPRADGRFDWSGAARAAPAVRSGSVCSAEVVVRERRPIEFVLPFLKKLAGVS